MLIPAMSKPSIGGGCEGRRMRWMSRAICEVVVEPFLFVRFRINDRVVERESGLLGDRFEDDKIARRKGRAHRAVGDREHAHVLPAVKQRRHHHGGGPEGGLAQVRQLRHMFQIDKVKGLAAFPGAAEQAFAGIDAVGTEVAIERDGRRGGLLQDAVGHFDERRAAFGNERRLQPRPGAIDQIKRAAVRIENAGRAFDDQTMQIIGPDRFAESFPEAVQEIEDERFLDLNFFFRAFERPDPAGLPLYGIDPARDRREQQPEEKNRPHGHGGQLTSTASRDEGLVLDNRGRP